MEINAGLATKNNNLSNLNQENVISTIEKWDAAMETLAGLTTLIKLLALHLTAMTENVSSPTSANKLTIREPT